MLGLVKHPQLVHQHNAVSLHQQLTQTLFDS